MLRFCVVCSTKLSGKQRRFCGNTCKKRAARHPELYPASSSNGGVQAGPPSSSGSVYQAVSTGDARTGLEALRGTLSKAIDRCEDAKELASLSARLVEVISKLEMLGAVEKQGSVLDELNAKREARRKGA